MIFGSVCSGIESASVAWKPLGWRAAFAAEIDPAPRAVLRHRHPTVPLHGDFTTIQAESYEPIDLLVGGTPCQSFSIAGLRGGLDDGRGNLALEYLRLARRLGPGWLVWENVPGVLSSNGGRDFGAILGGMVELGYGVAYRVLDAQHVRIDGFGRAVPQRRRRVFVVGCLGDWRRAAAVLFERQGLRRDPPPRREARARVAAPIAAGSPGGSGYRNDADTAAENLIAFGGNDRRGPIDVATALSAHPGPHGRLDFTVETFIAEPIPFDTTQITHPENRSRPEPGSPSHALAAAGHPPAIAFNSRQNPDVTWDRAGALGSSSPQAEAIAYGLGHNGGPPMGWAVRRLTPLECERLMGFPDGYTAVPDARGRPLADGPRYKALGNAMAVNVMRWIGRRIDMVEAIGAADVLEAAE